MTDEQPRSRAETVVASAGALARWTGRAYLELARRIPGAAAVEAELQKLERALLVELRRRLDATDPVGAARPALDAVPAPLPDVPAPAAATPAAQQAEPLRAAMAELLLRSMEQTAQRAREYLYLGLLRQLVPDEARILAALADGSTYPLVHVDVRVGVSGGERLLSHASTVGRAAGVADPAAVPRYVGRLRALDLVELGDADPTLSVAYDILLTDNAVRAAEEAARTRGRARIVRRTVGMSALGRGLWAACRPGEDLDTWAVAEPLDVPPVPLPPTEDPATPRNGAQPP